MNRTNAAPPATILVIDDERETRARIAEALAEQGYRSRQGSSGEEGLTMVKQSLPDLIITDVNMPKTDGLAFVARLRRVHGATVVPVIFMSGYSEPNQRIAALEVGGDDFLAKPLDLQELIARVRAHLRRFAVQQVLAQQAKTDELTCLLNRRGIFDVLDRELSRSSRTGQPVSVLVADVDRFKRINDSYGHRTGDEVLQTVGRILLSSVRACDRVGRIGGDEFLIVSPDTDPGSASQLASRLSALRPTLLATGEGGSVPVSAEVEVSLSVGAASSRCDDSSDGLIARADRSMYLDKRAAPTLVPATAS